VPCLKIHKPGIAAPLFAFDESGLEVLCVDRVPRGAVTHVPAGPACRTIGFDGDDDNLMIPLPLWRAIREGSDDKIKRYIQIGQKGYF
jgi:hypothetical protein